MTVVTRGLPRPVRPYVRRSVAPKPSNPSPPLVPVPETLLLKWNASLATFHLVFATLTLSLGNLDLTGEVWKTQIGFRRRNATTTEAGWDVIPQYAPVGSAPLTVLTALFFLLSSLFHGLNVVFRDFYFYHLARCRSPLRWTEYFFSAPVMIYIIAYMLMIRERLLLFTIAVLVATTMPFGFWVESVARPASLHAWTLPLRARLLPWAIGHVPQLGAWIPILVQFYESTVDLDDSGDRMPWFVHLILWGELLLFFSFGVASLVSQWSTPEHFCRGEVTFQVLSLVSKGLLGVLLLSNVLRLSEYEDFLA